MSKLGIKLPKAEMDFLEWYSKHYATPKASLYRDQTLHAFQQWKIEFLLELYVKGSIGFKKFCKLGNITFLEGMQIIELKEMDPAIPEVIDEYTTKITQQNITKRDLSIFKNGKGIKRTSPAVFLKNQDGTKEEMD